MAFGNWLALINFSLTECMAFHAFLHFIRPRSKYHFLLKITSKCFSYAHFVFTGDVGLTLFLRMKRKGMLVALLENVNSILFDALRAFIREELKKKRRKNGAVTVGVTNYKIRINIQFNITWMTL